MRIFAVEKTLCLRDAAFELNRNKEGDYLTIEDVFSRFKEIKEISGKGSQVEKIRRDKGPYDATKVKEIWELKGN